MDRGLLWISQQQQQQQEQQQKTGRDIIKETSIILPNFRELSTYEVWEGFDSMKRQWQMQPKIKRIDDMYWQYEETMPNANKDKQKRRHVLSFPDLTFPPPTSLFL